MRFQVVSGHVAFDQSTCQKASMAGAYGEVGEPWRAQWARVLRWFRKEVKTAKA